MDRQGRYAMFGAALGVIATLVVLNGGAYLLESGGGGRPQAQGEGSLACFCSFLAAPLGGLAGWLTGRRLGRGERPPGPGGRAESGGEPGRRGG